MKAWIIERRGDISQLKRSDAADPAAGPNDLVVEVKGAAMNSADLKVLSGRDGGTFLHSNGFPIRMGYDYAGIVREMGPEVRDWRVGQEVYGFLPYSMKTTQGSFSDLLRIVPSQTAAKPKNADFAEAACMATAASTALQALRDKGRLQAGQTVLVNGASGGVGACAVQIGKIMGAKVWGTCRQEKAEQVTRWGAHEVIDYQKTPFGVLNQTFDVILDAASTLSFSKVAPKLRPRGVYVTLLPSLSLLFGLVHSFFASQSCVFFAVQPRRDDLRQIAQWVEEERLIPPVDIIFSLSQLPDAFNEVISRKTKGKVGLRV
jgi:NADPH:quinone reductase-like Zn-dependent oxidoreductase